jgi:hypothetical protein
MKKKLPFFNFMLVFFILIIGIKSTQAQTFDNLDMSEMHIGKNVSCFIAELETIFDNEFGTANDESRISISNWSAVLYFFEQYNFLHALDNYSSSISGLLLYSTSSIPFTAHSDVFTSLFKANECEGQNPVTDKTIPKIITNVLISIS